MKKVIIAVACVVSLMLAKECKTMADMINGCVETEYNYDKKPIRQVEYKNKQEVRVVFEKTYYDNGNLASDYRGNVRKEYYKDGDLYMDCSGEGQDKMCKYYLKNDGYDFVTGYEFVTVNGSIHIKNELVRNYIEAVVGSRNCEKKCEFYENGKIRVEVFKQDNVKVKRDFDENGNFVIEFRDDKPFNGQFNNLEYSGKYTNGVKVGVWKEKNCDYKDYTEMGEYVNERKNGVWKLFYKDNKNVMDGQFKDGKLVSFTHNDTKYEHKRDGIDENLCRIYHNVRRNDLKREWRITEQKCGEVLIPNENGKTSPNNKLELCLFNGKLDGVNKLTLERDMGFFTKDMRMYVYELYFENGELNAEKSKCENGKKMEKIVGDRMDYTSSSFYNALEKNADRLYFDFILKVCN